MAEAVCSICGNTIFYGPNEVSLLADHFCLDHPDQDVGYFSILNLEVKSKDEPLPSTQERMSNQKEVCVGGSKGINICDPCECANEEYDFDCHKAFKTTVESWSQGPNNLKCPGCGKEGPPLIRRQRNKIAKSSLGAMCLLGCWPLCFLPFILGGSNILNLYCKNCGAFLATYDRHLGKLNVEKFEKINVPNLCCDM